MLHFADLSPEYFINDVIADNVLSIIIIRFEITIKDSLWVKSVINKSFSIGKLKTLCIIGKIVCADDFFVNQFLFCQMNQLR